jgi:hypothetical protein
MTWLLLADRLQLKRLVGRCAAPAAATLLRSCERPVIKGQLSALRPLSQRSLQLMMEILLKVFRPEPSASGHGLQAYLNAPISAWQAPGDLF